MKTPRLPLWAVLSIPFALVLSVVVATLVYAHQKNLSDLVNQEGANVLRSNNAHVVALLRQYLELPFQTQLSLADAITRQGLYHPTDLRPLEKHFSGVFRDVLGPHFTPVEMIQLGTETGNFVGVMREADGRLTVMLKDRRTGAYLHVHRGSGTQIDQTIANYDPRIRPWYKPVAESLAPRWSGLYISSANSNWLGVSAMSPVFHASGSAPKGSREALLGVISTDLSLTDLSRFLRETHLHQTFKSAVIYIVDAKGQLVAQSLRGPMVNTTDDAARPKFREALSSADDVVRLSFGEWTRIIGRADGTKPPDSFQVKVHGQDYLAGVGHYSDPRGLDWRIVTLVSAAELRGDTGRTRNVALAIAAAILLVGAAIGMLMFRRISSPIRATAHAAERLSHSTDPTSAKALVTVAGTQVRETYQLTQAFNAMAQRISSQMNVLQDLALKDPVTGLLNVNGLSESAQWPEPKACVLIMIGVHNISLINASMGTAAGSQLLKAIALRLKGAAPQGARLARGTGPEFILLQMHESTTTGTQAHDVDQLIFCLGRCFADAFVTDTDDLLLQASIGMVSESFTGPEIGLQALRKASLALRRAKIQRNAAYVRYDEGLEAQAKASVRMVNELKSALDRHELLVYFQPIVSLETGQLHGLEALVRWPHMNRWIPPSEFIPVAEESGLIVELGNWIMYQACVELVRWTEKAPVCEDFALHVNVSVRQLVQADFANVVADALARSGLAANHLTIEITESMLMQESASILTTINQLRDLGTVIALDDFGTGYSSLSYLNRFPFHDIKIDRSFLLEAEKSENGTAILRAVVDLIKGLGVASVAEGIETYGQAGILHRMGCTYGQGYLFGRPAPLAVAMEPFRQHSQGQTA